MPAKKKTSPRAMMLLTNPMKRKDTDVIMRPRINRFFFPYLAETYPTGVWNSEYERLKHDSRIPAVKYDNPNSAVILGSTTGISSW